MRHFLFALLFISIGLYGCSDTATTEQESETTTPVESSSKKESDASSSFKANDAGPVSDAETTVAVHSWVPGILKVDPDKVAVNLCIENGTYIYFITMDKTADIKNKSAEVYNAKQEMICEIGGPQMVNTCPQFTFNGTKDCNPVFLK